jgi:hypothetical protein
MTKARIDLPNLTSQRIERFWSHIDKSKGQGKTGDCWEWQKSRTSKGYGRFGLWKHNVRAHRLAYYLTTGEWNELNILHKCDNPPCCNPAHLFAGTDTDNRNDKIAKGRHIPHSRGHLRGDDNPARKYPEKIARGEKVGTSKLTGEQVRLIRFSKEPAKTFTDMFNISKHTVCLIRKNKTWKHIK